MDTTTDSEKPIQEYEWEYIPATDAMGQWVADFSATELAKIFLLYQQEGCGHATTGMVTVTANLLLALRDATRKALPGCPGSVELVSMRILFEMSGNHRPAIHAPTG